ncbi:MAG: tRNA dihydrouridine(20/20a) synthase DusA [Thiotrichales bacterium]
MAGDGSAWRFCVAPMLDWTDRHARYFMRLLSARARLYTEMVTTGAILRGERERQLGFHAAERPLALQLGGSEPAAMAACARIAADWGYDEVNINVGCPSDRVHSGRFGACLMATPETVADCVAAMRAATRLPITVKHRIGIDDQDSDADLERFVRVVAAAGCDTFVVHARKAWLKGLSPKENREVPPLDYGRVYRLKIEHPELTIVLNGGITTLDQCATHLAALDGVMLGREVYHNPYLLADVDSRVFGHPGAPPSRYAVVRAMYPYIESELVRGTPLASITRHLLGLFQGQPGARAWRRTLSERAHRPGAGLEVLDAALAWVREGVVERSAQA